jgi:hypothetical protein
LEERKSRTNGQLHDNPKKGELINKQTNKKAKSL